MFDSLLFHMFHNPKTHDLMEVTDSSQEDETWTVYNHTEGETTTISHPDFLAIADESTMSLLALASGECVMVGMDELALSQPEDEDEDGAWQLDDDNRRLDLMFR